MIFNKYPLCFLKGGVFYLLVVFIIGVSWASTNASSKEESSVEEGDNVHFVGGDGFVDKEEKQREVPPLSLSAKEVIKSKYLSLDYLLVQRVGVSGRIKPFDTFARETLFFITGKEKFKNWGATEVLMSWMLVPEHWYQVPFVLVREASLRKALELEPGKTLFSPQNLLQNRILNTEWQELGSLLQREESLSSHFQSVKTLVEKLSLFQDITRGKEPGWIPKNGVWLSLSQIDQLDSKEEIKKNFQQMLRLFVKQVVSEEKSLPGTQKNARLSAVEKELQLEGESLQQAIFHFFQSCIQEYPLYLKGLYKAQVEIHYNYLNPFRLAWIFYFSGLLLLLFFTMGLSRKFLFSLWGGFSLCGFLLHTYGMVLRSLIMERPPVTNMYETLLWVPWCALIMGVVLWRKQKFLSAVVGALVCAGFCLLLLDLSPSLLDKSLEPLEAVLRSNFWLSTHVLIITMSYAAFFLAFVLGDASLFLFFRDERSHRKKILQYHKAIKLCFQIGVVLLAGGTILGGIWADYSWGRFWGWDPKETWALISLLAYLALLHASLVGWVKEFGTAVGAVLIFFSIVMTWYGVNFVLGQGLHSYGFGSGGVEYVSGFALLHLIYVVGVAWWRKQRGLLRT